MDRYQLYVEDDVLRGRAPKNRWREAGWWFFLLFWIAVLGWLALAIFKSDAWAYAAPPSIDDIEEIEVTADMPLSEHFMLSEYCKQKGTCLVDLRLIEKLELLREKLGKPIVITSGYRSPEYNKKVGGAEHSLHMQGQAADIRVAGVELIDLAAAAEDVGFTGIGIYTTHVHVDIGNKRRWHGTSK